ncbi:MAG: 16S rRNA (cytosine(1402)-N(4))-methyltransferase RsmH [Candidatus Paceibacterota bacterium]
MVNHAPHIPVLLHETIEGLDLKPGAVVVDATVGAGGHALSIAQAVGKEGVVIGFDADAKALELATLNLKQGPAKFIPINTNFRLMATELAKVNIDEVDAVLFDLGVSSMQLDTAHRGFSFRFDEPLVMTLDSNPTGDTLTAIDLVNTLKAEDLAVILKNYGEEGFAGRIADAIVEARSSAPIETTARLVEIINSAVPFWYKKRKIHPATKTFQALRIAVNDELGALTEGLNSAWSLLKSGGHLGVISFQGLETKIVKDFAKAQKKIGAVKKVVKIKPSRQEILANHRSRSAILRLIQKI